VQLIAASGSPYDLQAAGDRRTYRDLLTPVGLREISTYAVGIGVHHEIPQRRPGLIDEAHQAGLVVHAWTVRDEHDHALAATLLDLGVDGLFTDQPDTAVAARARAASRLAESREATPA
jgi:glycerophosphoryl diester phosphodiesterase